MFSKKIYLFLLLCCLSKSTLALDDLQILRGLEALGDLEVAYPLAIEWAKQKDSYQNWRNIAHKYQRYDQEGQAYQQAWRSVRDLNQVKAYRDFIRLRPQSPVNSLAIHALFALHQQLDTIKSYMLFIKDFPNTPEAVQALLRIHVIGFERAKKQHTVAVYDAFVQTFKGAKQIPQAITLAFELEQEQLNHDLKQADYQTHERMARRLFNQARIAEKNKQKWVVARKYQLLDQTQFKDTKTFTDYLDREERLDYQQQQRQQQKELNQQLTGLRDALVTTLKTEHQALRKTLQRQSDQLEQAIVTYNRYMKRELENVNQRIDNTQQKLNTVNQRVDNTQSQMIKGFTQVKHNINAQMGAISDAISVQTEALEQASYEANYQQEQLLQQAQEEQRYQQRQAQRCAEDLAQDGKYGFWSECG